MRSAGRGGGRAAGQEEGGGGVQEGFSQVVGPSRRRGAETRGAQGGGRGAGARGSGGRGESPQKYFFTLATLLPIFLKCHKLINCHSLRVRPLEPIV